MALSDGGEVDKLNAVWRELSTWLDTEMHSFVDVCEMLEVKYPSAAERDSLSNKLRALWGTCMQKCRVADDSCKTVPPASSELCHGHLMIWQIGFGANAAVKGASQLHVCT